MVFAPPEKPSAEKFILESPLTFMLVKDNIINPLMKSELAELMDLSKGQPKNHVQSTELYRKILSRFPVFNRILKYKITEKKMIEIVFSCYYNGKVEELMHVMRISRSTEFKFSNKQRLFRFSAVGFLLKPYQDLVIKELDILTDTCGVHERFKYCLKHGKQMQILDEADKVLVIASEYLYAKFILFISDPDLTERIVNIFKKVCEILPDEWYFSDLPTDKVYFSDLRGDKGTDVTVTPQQYLLGEFLTLAIPVALKSHLDHAEVINGIVSGALKQKEI